MTRQYLLACLTLSTLASCTWAAGRGGNDGGGTPVLSAAENAGVLFMREEEKLARDVYLFLGDIYDIPVFSNIASSEQRHMDAVLGLIDKYGLDDPAAGNELGEFTDATLQALYDQLVAQGSASLDDALAVGVLIEETDIADLETHIAETSRNDIRRVYENLLRGSQNHLAAFQSQLDDDAPVDIGSATATKTRGGRQMKGAAGRSAGEGRAYAGQGRGGRSQGCACGAQSRNRSGEKRGCGSQSGAAGCENRAGGNQIAAGGDQRRGHSRRQARSRQGDNAASRPSGSTRVTGVISGIDAESGMVMIGDVVIFATEDTRIRMRGRQLAFDSLVVGQSVVASGGLDGDTLVAQRVTVRPRGR